MKKIFFYLFCLFALAVFGCITGCSDVSKQPVDYVNPLIGCGGHGHTFPGATVPFGMVQLSPDTRLDGWDGCSGYHYSDDVIFGFSHTHLSGTGCSDYGDILLMPTVGVLQLNNGKDDVSRGYASHFSHNNEKAAAGYYSVVLDDYDIRAELTATPRVGWHRYHFPKTSDAHVVLDLTHRDRVLEANVEIVGNNEIVGYRRSRAWANDQRLYFVIKFSKEFVNQGFEIAGDRQEGAIYASGETLKAWVDFDMTDNDAPLLVKVGVSAVSLENARKNIQSEAPEWDFDKIRENARNVWNTELSKIIVEGGSEEDKTNFYTALYHCFIAPNIYQDVNGDYRGRNKEVYHADFEYYTVFSLWDTYRALHPLLTIIDEKRTNDFINTFIKQWEQGGLLPVWELSACETNCMIGYHAVPVIADAYMKGIRNYDAEKAFMAMKTSALDNKFGLSHYKTHGFVPADIEGESVSKTLEYAYDDWCIAVVAKELGKVADASYFMGRAQSYKNLFDPETKFMRARHAGKWFEPFDPKEVNFNYTEANAWQYNFAVPQDISTLITLHGGNESFGEMLDKMFSETTETTGRTQADITGLIGQYAHGNEPSHHIAYLYNFAEQPWKTQSMVRRIMKEMYQPTPDGLCGNEDCGQMSAWYVLSAMGFYPVTPASNQYIIGSPLFKKVTINLENGNKFVIKSKNNSAQNFYIQSAKLNGIAYNKSYFTHQDITKGGTLVFEMGNKPNKAWGTESPRVEIVEYKIVPVPFVAHGERIFTEKTEITLGCADSDVEIYYTPCGSSQFELYTAPFVVTEDCTISMYAKKESFSESRTTTATFVKLPANRSIVINGEYDSQYSAGGDYALIDGIRGGENFRTGAWQGYYAQDVEFVVDLSDPKTVSYMALGCLQDQNSWIFMPQQVDFFLSADGQNYQNVGSVKNSVPEDAEGAVIKDFEVKIKSATARYVKIAAKNFGKCPAWHAGAGKDTYFFVDEMVIK
jgi:predicted alpha-1,2-mannosidase